MRYYKNDALKQIKNNDFLFTKNIKYIKAYKIINNEVITKHTKQGLLLICDTFNAVKKNATNFALFIQKI